MIHMAWVLGPGTHGEIEERIRDNPGFRNVRIVWKGGAWHDNCGLVRRHTGIVYRDGKIDGYIVGGPGGYVFTPPQGDLPCHPGALQFSSLGKRWPPTLTGTQVIAAMVIAGTAIAGAVAIGKIREKREGYSALDPTEDVDVSKPLDDTGIKRLTEEFKEHLDMDKNKSLIERWDRLQWWRGYLDGLIDAKIIPYKAGLKIRDIAGTYPEYRSVYMETHSETAGTSTDTPGKYSEDIIIH